MADPFIGEIRAFPYTFAPYGWASCDGQIISVQQNSALFAILGATFGGNGSTNFALPNLMGRAPVNFGTGTGLSPRDWGETVGDATVSLTANNFPPHSHAFNVVSNTNADQTEAAANHYLARTPASGKPPVAVNTYQPSPSANTRLAADMAQQAGTATGPIPHDNMQPYLPVMLCIALYGIFPARG